MTNENPPRRVSVVGLGRMAAARAKRVAASRGWGWGLPAHPAGCARQRAAQGAQTGRVVRAAAQAAGRMFWLKRNMLPGSYLALIAASRA